MATASGATTDRKQVQRQVMAALEAPFVRPSPTLTYRFGLLIVAVLMVLLPLLYLAVVGSTAYGTYWWATHETGLLGNGFRGGAKLRLLMYLGPIFAGGIATVFLLKPFLAKRGSVPEGPKLDRRTEPFLFGYVDRICDKVGAPRPDRIELDCDINASAGFPSLGAMLSNKLVVTLGLPLVAGLDLRQLTALLAHELGHCSQGAGMRLTHLIRSIQGWFVRVAHERDAWDEWLDTASTGGLADLAILLAKGIVWVTRRVLLLFAAVSHFISLWMGRLMEYDADRYATRIAGAETLGSLLMQLRLLGASRHLVQRTLADTWRERKLGDDLPALVLAQFHELPKPVAANVRKDTEAQRTSAWDTHPAWSDRVAAARKEKHAGTFALDLPATVVFDDFGAVSRKATLAEYRASIGPEVGPQNLVTAQAVGERKAAEKRLHSAADRYYQGLVRRRPLSKLACSVAPPADPGRSLHELREARTAVEASLAAARALMKKQQAAEEDLELGAVAEAALAAGIPFSAKDLRMPSADAQGVARARERTATTLKAVADVLDPLDEWQSRRMTAALALLHHPQVQARVTDAPAKLAEAQRIAPALAALEGSSERAGLLAERTRALVTLLRAASGRQELPPELVNTARSLAAGTHGLLGATRSELLSAQHPLLHSPESLGAHLVPELPQPGEVGRLAESGIATLESFHASHGKLLGRLAEIATEVEQACGLPPLSEPPAS